VIGWLMVGALAQAGCGGYRSRPPDPDLIHSAVQQLTAVMVHDNFNPLQTSRVFAYASVAAYEALRHDRPAYQTLAGQLNGLRPVPTPPDAEPYYFPLAGIHAFLTVGRALTFSQQRVDSVLAAMHQRIFKLGLPRRVYQRSVAYGNQVAQHILAWAAGDGFPETRSFPKYVVRRAPGRWVPTSDRYLDALEPHWALHRPFVMDSASLFRPASPLAFSMSPGSPFYVQAKEVYDTGRQLTESLRDIAFFWDDNPFVIQVHTRPAFAVRGATPGGHWMSVVGIAARKSGADLMRSADAYVRAAIAMADGFISCWDEKYRSTRARPVTVINAALDRAWLPLLHTPPSPEHTSEHSVVAAAAAAVLTDLFGQGFAFVDSTQVQYGLPARSFASFDEAATEAAISRLYGGTHYRRAIEEGTAQGRRVGELVIRRVQTRSGELARQ
jgi:hypothetical protein